MALTADQVYALARSAGLTTGRAVIATAVAKGESGFNPQAHNTTPPDDSYGLWQINMLGGLGPARRVQFGISSNSDLFKPAVNAKAMRIVSSNGLNFSPWTAYSKGTYRQHMGEAQAAAARVEKMSPIEINRLVRSAGAGTSGTGLIPEQEPRGGPLDTAAEIANLGKTLATAFKWLPGGPTPSADDVAAARHGLLRIGFVLGGVIIIIMGLGSLLEPLVKPVLRAAGTIPGSPIPG